VNDLFYRVPGKVNSYTNFLNSQMIYKFMNCIHFIVYLQLTKRSLYM
jgi:hypothetical protein